MISYLEYNTFLERHLLSVWQVAQLPINTCCFSFLVYLLAFQNYACVSDVTLPKALDMELRGDIEDCLIDVGKKDRTISSPDLIRFWFHLSWIRSSLVRIGAATSWQFAEFCSTCRTIFKGPEHHFLSRLLAMASHMNTRRKLFTRLQAATFISIMYSGHMLSKCYGSLPKL